MEESPAGFGGGFRLQRLATTHGGEIVPNFGTIPGQRLRHSVQLHPRRAALFVVCSAVVQRVRVCSCPGIVEGAALLLCQFLVQSICRPQRLPVVVDVVQRVLTAFLRRVCNWVGKLSVERFSGDCGAILTPYACARFLAPTAAKVARACKPCAWIWFCPGGGSIKNTPRVCYVVQLRRGGRGRRNIEQHPHGVEVSAVCACCYLVIIRRGGRCCNGCKVI